MAPHISVCICTFRRGEMLKRLLGELFRQETDGAFTYSVVVSDNDQEQSAAPVVEAARIESPVEITYCSEPRANIALARNRALEHASGDFIAFIDDDEFPGASWLRTMLQTCEEFAAAGVLGPVKPHFEQLPPAWILKGRFCERPEHSTGRGMPWEECRTGNVLFRRQILARISPPFDPEFGTGGEDKEFFRKMTAAGEKFVWCNEAPVFETVPPSRWTRSYMLRRALLRGKNILRHPAGRAKILAKSVVAVPFYAAILPFTHFGGHHRFMDCSIRFCDHLGRILALVGLNRVRERQM